MRAFAITLGLCLALASAYVIGLRVSEVRREEAAERKSCAGAVCDGEHTVPVFLQPENFNGPICVCIQLPTHRKPTQ